MNQYVFCIRLLLMGHCGIMTIILQSSKLCDMGAYVNASQTFLPSLLPTQQDAAALTKPWQKMCTYTLPDNVSVSSPKLKVYFIQPSVIADRNVSVMQALALAFSPTGSQLALGGSDGIVRLVQCEPLHKGFDHDSVCELTIKNLFPGKLAGLSIAELCWNDTGAVLIACVDILRDGTTATANGSIDGDVERIEGGVVIWGLSGGAADVKYAGLLESNAGVQGLAFIPSAPSATSASAGTDASRSGPTGRATHFDQSSFSSMYNLELFAAVDPQLQSLKIWDVGNAYCVAELCEDAPILGSVITIRHQPIDEDHASIVIGGPVAELAVERARVVYAYGWGDGETTIVLALLQLCLHRRGSAPTAAPMFYYRLTKLHEIQVHYNITAVGRDAGAGLSGITKGVEIVPPNETYFAANLSKEDGALLLKIEVEVHLIAAYRIIYS